MENHHMSLLQPMPETFFKKRVSEALGQLVENFS
jgi:hypothetical protein